MSIGSHRIDVDDRDQRGALARFERERARSAALRAALEAEYSLSYRFDMPFTMGYNTTRTRYYGDRHLPHVAPLRTIDGKPKSVYIIPFGLRHEITESALQAVLHIPHETAHHMATAVEYEAVKHAGINLDSYRKWFDKWIKADEIRDEKLHSLRIPPDFDTTPLEADSSADGQLLLKRVRESMSRGSRSTRSWGFQRRSPAA